MKTTTILFSFLFIFILSAVIIAPTSAQQKNAADNPIEAGDVNWGRDFDGALTKSRQSGKPVLVLFQEIPGCIGCRTFGSEVLTEPLLVEAIETEFIPVLVYNNRSGTKDAELLKRFNEPSWNYQVIRFLDGNGNDIIPRRDRIWTTAGVASRMITALDKAGRSVPNYLKTLVVEHDRSHHHQVAFAMACFWTGEYKLGKVPGVVTTEAGWYDNREVTLVTYHTKLLQLKDLVGYASKERCAQRVYLLPGDKIDTSRFTVKPLKLEKYKKAARSDQKKQLHRWKQLNNVNNITPMQLTKLNAFGPDSKKEALQWLSPMQLKQFSE